MCVFPFAKLFVLPDKKYTRVTYDQPLLIGTLNDNHSPTHSPPVHQQIQSTSLQKRFLSLRMFPLFPASIYYCFPVVKYNILQNIYFTTQTNLCSLFSFILRKFVTYVIFFLVYPHFCSALQENILGVILA